MSLIKLRSISFGSPPFRKLGTMTVPFAERMTIVAGHNGVGKSTILALAANASGLSRSAHRSYFDRTFQQSFNEIIYLDYVAEYEDVLGGGGTLPTPTLEYSVDGVPLFKRSTITPRTERRELRVVARNDPHQPLVTAGGKVGPDAKVPLPTIYLGMIRMLPIGESDPAWITSTAETAFESTDAKYIEEFIRKVVDTGRKPSAMPAITSQAVKGTKKTAKHPPYAYSSRAISLGQDSLSSIATAVASFRRLKREWPDYAGGLLVIDELDAGLHPHAQKTIVRALLNAATELQLQVIATTHSMYLIEAVHPDMQPAKARSHSVDSVVYLANTSRPFVLPDLDLDSIRADMNLEPPILKNPRPPARPPVKVYFEDPEASYFFGALVSGAMRRRIKKATGATLKLIPLSVGCGNLRAFHKHDPYFSSVVIALDGDSKRKTSDAANVVLLPCGQSPSGQSLNPERTLYSFIESLAGNDPELEAQRSVLRRAMVTGDQLRQHLLDDTIKIEKRDSSKAWFKARKKYIDQWDLVALWGQAYPDLVSTFEQNVIDAVTAAVVGSPT